MGFRSGSDNPRSGPRLPRDYQANPSSDVEADDAKGEKVPRCLTCGKGTGTLITGSFIPDRYEPFAGRTFRYRLCVKCLEYANGPQDPDPLHVEAA